MDKYRKVIGILRSNRPQLTRKGRLIENVMEGIKITGVHYPVQHKLNHYLFGWVEIGWLRGTMGIAAAVLIGIFIIQQVVITDRINRLEKQLIQTVNTMNNHEPDLGILQKVLLNKVTKDRVPEDSIMVSANDLEELLRSFLELQQNYEHIRQKAGIDSYIRMKIRQNLEESDEDDTAKLKL